ncbi:hypothetical protein CPJCM30710_07050 [Clostridium polyendosporum]|uniref:Uncharacterized protein n=1 Tax=Clostridium polyendosporum TaxID=69208 RepID=A0A919RYE0_9CLOT|nr:hypothetical protein [Clostridium polyendosporum]GIM28039.1 hypothetical protein CPJCM30710_07050 [Clostridium polyendosporum]
MEINKGIKPVSIYNSLEIINQTRAADSIEVIYLNKECAKITFEGGGQGTPIPDVNVGFSTVQFPAWLTLTSGNYSNEPSPVTIAFWLSQSGYPNNYREIIFTNPIASVSLFYASAYNVTLEAYDQSNNLIASTAGPANYNNGYTQWDPLSIDRGNNIIKKVRVIGLLPGYTGIDDLTICRVCRGLLLEK